MTIAPERVAEPTTAHDDAGCAAQTDLGALTPDAARQLAALLAPHLVAMRAVTAGTQYADGDGGAAASDADAAGAVPAVSPAIKIFIAGMLERIPA